MTNTKPRVTSMNREGHTEHYTLADGSKRSARVDWTIDDARDGMVAEWFESGIEVRRTVRDEDGKTVAVLVSADEYEEGCNAIMRINDDAYERKDSTYTPFVHHPSGNMERLINTDALETVIRRLVHGKTAEADDLTREERDRIHYAALVAAIEFGFEPDSRGLVPVLTPGRAMDGHHTEYLWSFLYRTPAAGLFLRADDAIFGGIEYTLVTGSGYALVKGFWEREWAEELAVKLADAAPGINWFTVRNDGELTSEIKATLTGIIREHGFWRKDDA